MRKFLNVVHYWLARLVLFLSGYDFKYIKDNITKEEISVQKINDSTFHLNVIYKVLGLEFPLLYHWKAVNDPIRTFRNIEEANECAIDIIEDKTIENVSIELS